MSNHKRLFALALTVLLAVSGWAAARHRTLSIGGTPSSTVTIGTTYTFQPDVTRATRRTLAFSVNNKPAWAAFNTQTGLLSGTPGTVGISSNIVISVNDGVSSASLSAFSITASAAAVQSTSSSSSSLSSSSAGNSNVSSSSSSIASPTSCAQNSSSYVTTGVFDWKRYGNYVVNNDNWGYLPGQMLWTNSEQCWGVTTNGTTERGGVGSYPTVTRGWAVAALSSLSTPGTNDWTTTAGMGIAVTQLTKAKVSWAFTAPTTKTADLVDPPRWMALMDIYFHKTPTPAATDWPPFLDLMINQALVDAQVGATTFFALVASASNPSTVTIGGITYLVYIDEKGEDGFHKVGGHNIHLLQLPTQYTNNTGTIWGVQTKTVTDVGAIIAYFSQSSPRNDAGAVLKNAAGAPITSPLITPDLYLNAINAGWEIDVGTKFTNNTFCVSLQSEADCP
jgi:hypothetical protein